MPITKPRPNISELIATAAEQRKQIFDSIGDMLARPYSIWTNRDSSKKFVLMIRLSRFCKQLLINNVVIFLRIIVALLSATLVAIEANHGGEQYLYILELILNSYLLLESLVRMFAIPIYLRVEGAFNRSVFFSNIIFESGFIDLIVCIVCFSLDVDYPGLWFRLIRFLLLSKVFLEVFPYTEILLSAIRSGLKSVLYTILLLFLVILTYASLCKSFFCENDPFRFGTFELAGIKL